MRSKSFVLLGLAVACGLIASIGISQVMERRHAADAPAAPTEPVFVAGVDLNYNDQITPEKLKIEEWPKDKIHADALRTIDEIKGQRVAHKIFAGEQIRKDKLMGSDGHTSVAGKIPPGYRVMPVKVDAVTGAAGLLLPNDRVDVLVYLARNPGTGIDETSTKTILQDVRVFAVDTTVERKPGEAEPIAAKTVSLLVTPAQAEKITLATEMGTVRLVMRSPDDSSDATAHGANIRDIFGGGEKMDRAGEEPQAAPETKQPSGDALSWLEQQRSGGSAAPALPAVETPAKQPWKMTLIEGSEVRQVELNSDNQLPSLAGAQQPIGAGSEPSPPGEENAPAAESPSNENELPPQSESESKQG